MDLDINEQSFAREISKARTFGFLKDVEALQARGLAKGGSLDNAIVLDDEKIINPEGLRFDDEFVRHKALDALGDLVTLEMPLMGHVVLYKAGHDIMNKLIHNSDFATVLPHRTRCRYFGRGKAVCRMEFARTLTQSLPYCCAHFWSKKSKNCILPFCIEILTKKTLGVFMIIGVPKEIKISENRVGMTEAGVRQYSKRRTHSLRGKRRTGVGSGIFNDQYEKRALKF